MHLSPEGGRDVRHEAAVDGARGVGGERLVAQEGECVHHAATHLRPREPNPRGS